MGKYEKKPHKTEYEDIQNVFQKRDRERAERHGAQQGAAQDYPDVPGFLNEPRRIRGDADYSVESMRQVHEGQAVDGSGWKGKDGVVSRVVAGRV